MTCTEIRKQLPELALGDLDAEPAAAVAAHVAGCADCRAAKERIGRAVGVLRSVPAASPSTERRSAAVAAMARVHAEQSEKLLARPRLTWAPWIAAAAAFLVLVAGPLLRTRSWSLEVASLRGRADLLDRSSGTWRPLAAGEKVRVGDRLVTQPGTVVELAEGPHRVWLDQETSIDLVDVLALALDRGRLCVAVDPSAGEALRISDISNSVVRVSGGRVEVSLRDVQGGGMVGGSVESREGHAVIPATRTESSRRLVARVDRGMAELRGAQDQRLRASAGQQGTFDFGGQPSTGALADRAIAPWAGSDER
ncbi:MAG TPA: zf-HC2 domain-containing protein [Planctomycetota bacterium]|nr:zf-HC2 domain-containing protein [Planctomycetota bacterium]